jgi:hypothetical protein
LYDENNIDITEEEQFENFLVEQLYGFVHGDFFGINEQPSHGLLKVDINIVNHDFEEYEYDGIKMELSSFLQENESLKD